MVIHDEPAIQHLSPLASLVPLDILGFSTRLGHISVTTKKPWSSSPSPVLFTCHQGQNDSTLRNHSGTDVSDLVIFHCANLVKGTVCL